MRPVFRGDTPTDNNGNSVVFKEYGDARDDLIDRIGDYCSYCEAPLLSPAIEHIQPKSKELELKNSWHNFLLTCTYCNSIKKDKPIDVSNISQYFWPDTDNTFRAFLYKKDCLPEAHPALQANEQQIALNTLELTGLNRRTNKDRRWIKRIEAWGKAETAKTRLDSQVTQSMYGQVIDTATSTGFWSVWMTVFQDDTDMRCRLIQAFKGTCIDCFNTDTQPIKRTGGKL
jgi:uncharacterized protein (TIGR02646 family)